MTFENMIKALEKNGLKQIRGSYIKYNEYTEVVGACALGQIAINLRSTGSEIGDVLDFITRDARFECPSKKCDIEFNLGFRLRYLIIHLNDEHSWKFNSIAKYLRKIKKEFNLV